MTTSIRAFEPDCQNCAGLCCVAFAFDRSEDFGHNKPADSACKHLDGAYRCTIHDHLESRGYRGCVRFNCHGAGQRVTREVFGGGDWQKNPQLTARMSAAFRAMRRVHELVLLLDAATLLSHKLGREPERQRLASVLDPEGGWTEDSLAEFERSAISDEVGDFLRSLAGGVTRR